MLRLDDSFFESMAEKSDFKDGNHLQLSDLTANAFDA